MAASLETRRKHTTVIECLFFVERESAANIHRISANIFEKVANEINEVG